MSIRVLLAEDQAPVRLAFRIILDAQPDISVVAEAADGREALDLARRHRPDVVLADIRMPHLDGLELTRRLTAELERTRVVVLTTFDLDEYVHTALDNGACGFLLKRASPALLVEGVRAAAAGDMLISPELTARLLRGRAAPDATDVHLTERELAGPARRGRAHERRHRRRIVPGRGNREEPRRGHQPEARRAQPGRPGGLGLGNRPKRDRPERDRPRRGQPGRVGIFLRLTRRQFPTYRRAP